MMPVRTVSLINCPSEHGTGDWYSLGVVHRAFKQQSSRSCTLVVTKG
jgi:hypothetical protein